MQDTKHALVAFGANLPFGESSPKQTILLAVACLSGLGFDIVALSRMFKTPCFPKDAGPEYVNAAAVLMVAPQTDPEEILQHLHAVENRFGRNRATRWGMRTLDIDLIALGDLVRPGPAEHAHWRGLPAADQARLAPDRLILPHPRLQDRSFVLVPLADVAPDWRHPVLGQTVLQMRDALPEADRAEVVPLV